MFNLIPWKRRSGNIAVRRDEPGGTLSRDDERDLYPLARLRHEFDSMLNRFFDDAWFGGRLSNLPSHWHEPWFSWDWDWDFGWKDHDNEYVFHAELPGFEPEEFDVKISGKVLTVRAEHKDEKKETNGGSHYRYGSFSRSVTLPHGVDEEKIEARYHSGVLELHLPKTDEAQGKRIEVKSA
jgi:HSP20 family protein